MRTEPQVKPIPPIRSAAIRDRLTITVESVNGQTAAVRINSRPPVELPIRHIRSEAESGNRIACAVWRIVRARGYDVKRQAKQNRRESRRKTLRLIGHRLRHVAAASMAMSAGIVLFLAYMGLITFLASVACGAK